MHIALLTVTFNHDTNSCHHGADACAALYRTAFQFSDKLKILRCGCKDGDKCMAGACLVCMEAFECFLNTLVRLGEIIEWKLTRLGSHCVYVIASPCCSL